MLLLLTWLCTGGPAGAEEDLEEKLPSLDDLVRYGCRIQSISMVDHGSPRSERANVWRVIFWAEHQSPLDAKPREDWEILYSYREKRMKAFADCDDFMERLKRAKHRESEQKELAERKTIRDGS